MSPLSLADAQRVVAAGTATGMSTADLYAASRPGAPLYGIEQTNTGLVVFGGGLLLTRDEEVVGAVGVRAGAVDQDVDVATAAVGALESPGG